jgi:hypothetical protein
VSSSPRCSMNGSPSNMAAQACLTCGGDGHPPLWLILNMPLNSIHRPGPIQGTPTLTIRTGLQPTASLIVQLFARVIVGERGCAVVGVGVAARIEGHGCLEGAASGFELDGLPKWAPLVDLKIVAATASRSLVMGDAWCWWYAQEPIIILWFIGPRGYWSKRD